MSANDPGQGASWDGTSYRMDLGHDEKSYGTPIEGSKTEKRGKKAGVQVSQEVIQVCGLIYLMGAKMPNGKHAIKFGRLFNIYQSISNKLVGMLLRARKHGLVHFPGEILYQRRDEEVIIWLEEIPPAVQEWIDLHDWEKDHTND